MARVLLPPPNERGASLGDVTLQAHQLAGVRRLLDIIARHRGALLADEVGLGKTYTALAVARHFNDAEVVAPAALRAMWHEATSRAHLSLDFVSSESLSRKAPLASSAHLVIVDEAHWFRNPATRRYRHLARRYRNAAVLLLSATPLHNRPADLHALFALFLGRKADRLTPHDVGALTVRRGREMVPASESPPPVLPTEWRRVRCDARVVAALQALEPPVPARDGDVAMALLRLTLLHRLSSSHAALRATLKRLLSRALALLDAANAGRYPTAGELRAWLVTDNAIQLAFPELVAQEPAHPDVAVSREAIERHIASVRAALSTVDAAPNQDRLRAAFVAQLMRRFGSARIVAFSQYDATVHALARELRHERGVAALSGRGGRIASGRISRLEILQQFDATHAASGVNTAMRIRLLLTTDLLSEGVNLHNAEVVLHLDVPWTPARLEQRIGRLSRIGSPHECVHVFGIAPSSSLERVKNTIARLRAKWRAGRRRFGESTLLLQDPLLMRHRKTAIGGSHSSDAEQMHRILNEWLGASRADPPAAGKKPLLAHVKCSELRAPIALALLGTPSGHLLVATDGAKSFCTHPGVVLRVARHLSHGDDPIPDWEIVASIVRRTRRFAARRRGESLTQSSAAGTAVTTLQSRIARTIARLPRSMRSEAQHLSEGMRASMSKVRSAGDNALLAEIATRFLHVEQANPMRWLAALQAELSAAFGCGWDLGAAEKNWRVDAILIGT